MITLIGEYKKYIYIFIVIVLLVYCTIYMTTSNPVVLKFETLNKGESSQSDASDEFSTQAYISIEGIHGDVSLVSVIPTKGEADKRSTTNIPDRRPTFLDLERSLCVKSFEDETEGKSKKPCPTKGIVSIHQGGRLANQIWEFAAIWAVGKETGLEAYAPRCIYNTISKVFKALPCPSMEEIGHCHVNLENFTDTLEEWNGNTQGIVMKKYTTKSVMVSKLYKHIPLEFPLRDELVEKNTKVLLEAKEKYSSDTFVGIHVRRTDYTEVIEKQYNGTAPEKDFFFKAMKYYETKYKNVTFVLVSDDREWCEQNLGSKENLFIAPPATPEEDLALMSICNHSIFDFGTYGAWGALYASGETVYYYVPKYSLPQSIMNHVPSWRTV